MIHFCSTHLTALGKPSEYWSNCSCNRRKTLFPLLSSYKMLRRL
jgi:hypothetical protein